MDINSKAYKRAFINYLRRGVPIEVSLKQESVPITIHPAEGAVGNIEGNRIAGELPSQKYVWRTVGDDKVRPSHAANDGLVFSLENPPPNGFPGSEHGCRCTAEPYIPGETEYANQKVKIPSELPAPNVKPDEWNEFDFLYHFFHGNGMPLDLENTGNLQGVIEHFFYKLKKAADVQNQIIQEARKYRNEDFSYDFNSSYHFGDYRWVFGRGTVSGLFKGKVITQNGMMYITGEVNYIYQDTFTDPGDIRQTLRGTSTIPETGKPDYEFDGIYYSITGRWQTSFEAEAKVVAEESRYKWPVK